MFKSTGVRLFVLFFVILWGLGATDAWAQVQWTGGGDGTSWSDAANWSSGTVPGTDDAVVIDLSSSVDYVVTVDDNYTISSLLLDASRATLRFEGPLTVSTNAEQRVGRMEGPQNLIVSDTLRWRSGPMAGAGETQVGTLLLSSSQVKTLDERQLTLNNGGAFADGYNFYGRNGARLVIQSDATFDVATTNNSRLFYYDGTGARPTMEVQGRFRKLSGTTSTITVDWALLNGGQVIVDQAEAGLNFRGPITDDNGLYRASAGRLDITTVGETTSFGSSSRFDGAGTVDFSGGTFTLNGTLDVTGTTEVSGASNQGASVTLASGMTLASWGTLLVRDRGTLDVQLTTLPAVQNLTLDFGATVALTAPLTVQGAYSQSNQTSTLQMPNTLTVQGAMTWQGGTITGGGTVEARGGLSITGDGASASYTKQLDGSRLVVFENTTATYVADYFFGGNGAVLEVQPGATFSIEVPFATRPFQLLSGSTTAPLLLNRGTVQVVSPLSGTVDVDWALENRGTILVDNADAILRFDGAITDGSGDYEAAAGRLDFRAIGETYEFTPDSEIRGAGIVAFSGGTATVNGQYNVTGTTEIAGASNQGATVTFPSTMSLSAIGSTLLRVHSRGTLDVQTSTIPDVGRLEIGFGGTLTLASALTVTGGMALENASARFISDQDLIVEGPIAWQGGYMEGGVDRSGVTTANGGITFSGGAGSASWNKGLRNGRTLVVASGTTAEYVGTRSFEGSNDATLRIEEGALFDLQEWANLLVASGSNAEIPPRIINNGTFRKSGGTSESRIDWPLTNSGVVEVGVDRLNLRREISDQGGTYRTTAADAELRFEARTGFNFGEASTLSGPGMMHFFYPDPVSIFGTYDVTGRSKFSGNGSSLRADVTFEPTMNLVSLGALDLGTDFESGGIARIETSAPLTVPTLSLGGSGELYLTPDLTVTGDASLGNANTLLAGASTLTVDGLLTWKGGVMAGRGTTIANGDVRFLGGAGSASWNKVLDQRTFVLPPGTIATYEGTRSFTGTNAALFLVQEGATLDIQQWADFNVPSDTDGQPILRNEGAVRKSGGDSDTRLSFDLENAGVLEITNDELVLLGTLTNSGRIQGTTTYDVTQIPGTTNNGTIAPGLSPSVLTFEGSVPFSSDATLEIEIGGPTAGTDHDQLAVTGTAQLGGQLDLSTINGFTPADGDRFTILTAAEVQGTFDVISQPADAEFAVQYNSTSVELVAAANSPPVATNDAAETTQDTPIVIDVLANDTDPDEDPLQVTSVTVPTNGTSTIVDAGVEYTPDPGFTGEDSFSYVVSDGRGSTDEATVTVTVVAPTGTLAGTVFDNATEGRIAGAQVEIPSLGRATTTNSTGGYSFADVPTGSYEVTASATGYRASTLTVVINESSTTTANFFLRVDDGLVRWTGDGDGASWTDPNNWDSGTVPTDSDVALIDLDPGERFTVFVDAASSVGGLRLETTWGTLQVDNALDVGGDVGLASGTIAGETSLTAGGPFTFSGGTINGAGSVVMNGGLTWTGGGMYGSGQTTVNGPTTLQTEQEFRSAGRPLSERTLTLNGTTTFEEGYLDTRQGATVVVGTNAVVQFADDRTGIQPLDYTSPRPLLDNRGLIVKTGRGDSFYTSQLGYQEDTFRGDQSITIQNTGTIRSDVGTMTIYVAEDTDVGGVVEASAGARVNFFRARFSATEQLPTSATIRGEGTFLFRADNRFTGTFDLAGTAQVEGNQTFASTMTLQRIGKLQLRTYRDDVFTFAAPNTPAIDTFLVRGLLDQQSDFTVTGRLGMGSEGAATVSGTGTITVGPDGEMLWGPGRLGGSGTVDVQGRLTAVVASYLAGDFYVQESEKWLDGRTLIVRGPATWDDATLNFENGGFLDVQSGAVFDLQHDALFQPGEQAANEEGMRLAGRFLKSGVGRRTSVEQEPVAYDNVSYGASFALPVDNDGTFSIEAGSVVLQNASFTNAGLLQGTDTLDVSASNSVLTNTGAVGPGTSPGRLTVVGPFDNTGATLTVELAGTTAGTTYDQLVVEGNATLGGTLDLSVLDPFDPPGDSEYVILTAQSVSGAFDTVNTPSLQGRTVEITTTETEVRVRVVQAVTNTDPVASNDAAETNENTAVVIDVLANDSDDDGDALSVSSVGAPANGTAILVDAGIQYTPNDGFVGEDAFSYVVSDGRGGTDEGTVTVTVIAPNTPPVAEDDVARTDVGTPVVVDVLANDRDADGDALSVAEVGSPANGTTTRVDGGIEYTPNDGFSGEDAFTYVVSDGRDGTDEATVTVSVGTDNAPPVAANDSVETTTGTPVVVDVLANDRDADGDALSISSVGSPTSGTATRVDGGIEYTSTDDFTGEDSFSYQIDDGNGGTDEATIVVTVRRPNGAPVAENDSLGTDRDTPVRIAVLANDRDPDGDSLRIASVGTPENGTAEIDADVVVYTPAEGFTGTDRFSYTVADGREATDEATVTVTVSPPNTAPVAVDDEAGTVRDAPVTIDVLANDSDPDGDPLSVSFVGEPEQGTAVRTEVQSIRYTPAPGFTGTDTFRYRIDDGRGGTAEALVTVTVEALRFAVTDLGTLGGEASRATAMNDAGMVVGLSLTSDGAVQAFAWTGGTMQPIAPLGFRPFAVNEQGVTAGYVEQDTTVEATLRGSDGTLTRLGTLGGRSSVAYALNDAGQVVGTAQTSAGTYRAFEWERTMRDLGRLGGSQSEAFAINPQGTSAGAVVQRNRIRAWVGDRIVSGEDEGRAYAINGLGQAAGSALLDGQVVARVWRADEVVDLGNLGDGWTEAYDINDAGWVVGASASGSSAGANATVDGKQASKLVQQWRRDPAFGLRRGQLTARSKTTKQAATQHLRAFLWIDGTLRDLNDFLPDEAGWTLLEARHVNNRGQIVGYGLLNDTERAFLLTPTDQTPPTATDDVLTVAAGESQRLSVLANDTDDDGDALQIVSVTPPQLGTAHVSSDGTSIQYRAAPNVQGTDVFSYVASDGTGMTSRGTVRLDVAIPVDPTSTPRLEPSAPNPASSQVRLRYLLPKAAHVRLAVYDVLGRRQAVLVDQHQQPGAKDVMLNVSRWPAGTYFYRLTVDRTVDTRKLMVVR